MLSKRALFKTSAGAVYRLLEVFPDGAKPVAYIFGMEGEKSLPKQIPLQELKDSLKSKEFLPVPTSSAIVVANATTTDARDSESNAEQDSPAQILFKWRRELIAPLVDDDRIYVRKHRGQLVATRAKEMNASEQTVMTCLRLYWRGGMTFDALMPEFHHCGTAKHATVKQHAPRGRKPKGHKPFIWNPELKKKVLTTLKAVLRKNPKESDRVLYRRALLKHFSTTTLVEVNGKQKAIVKQLALGERPSRKQLYYLVEKELTLEQKLRNELGDDGYDNNAKVKTGSARKYAAFAGNIYEIDATKVDVYIVDEDDPATVIGKATLYLVIDVYTRLLVGFHLTLDDPSWSGAMEAFMSLVEDKQKLCERWGFDYDESDWPAHGVTPAFVRADRGPEFLSKASDTIADNLNIHFINTPARKATRRGTIECSFKLEHVPIRANVGGYTPPEDFGKRQLGDLRNTATRTLKSLGCELLAAMRLANRRVHRRVNLPAAKIWAKEQAIPIRMWELSTDDSVGMHTQYEEDILRFKLLHSSKDFSLTHRGVFYKGLLYIPEKSLQQQWLLPARGNFRKVTATYDRRSVAVIYVHDLKDRSKWTTMHLHPNYAMYQGRSWAQWEALKIAKVTLSDLAEEHNLALELQNDLEAGERERDSHARTQKALDASGHRSRTANTRVLREAAKDKAHLQIPAMPTTAIPASSPPAPRVPGSAPGQPAPKSPRTSSSSAQPLLATTAANNSLQALLKLKAKA